MGCLGRRVMNEGGMAGGRVRCEGGVCEGERSVTATI